MKRELDRPLIGHWRYNIEQNTLYRSESVYDLFEIEPDSVSLHLFSFIEYVEASQKKTLLGKLHACLEEGVSFQMECLINTRDKRRKIVNLSSSAEIDESGNIINILGSCQDITERKYEEERLKLLESSISHTKDAIIITDFADDNKIIFSNEAFLKMTGYSKNEVLGRNPRFLQGPLSDRKGLDRISQSLVKGEACELTTINYKKNGEEFWVNFSMTPVYNKEGIATHYISVERNVTEQKKQEKEEQLFKDISLLFNNEETLRTSLDNLSKLLCEFGDYSIVEIWMPNYSKTKLQLSSWYTLDVNGEEFRVLSADTDIFDIDQGFPGFIWKNRTMQYWDLEKKKEFLRLSAATKAKIKTVSGIPLITEDEIVGILLLFTNASGKKFTNYEEILKKLEHYIAIEIRRKQQELELKNIFKYAPDIICLVDNEGRFIKMNEAGFELLGYTEEEVYSIPFIEMVHPDDKRATLDIISSFNNENSIYHFDNRYITKSGEIIWLTWNAAYSEDNELLYGVAKNITVTKDLESLLDRTTNIAKVGAWELDLNAPPERSLFWSPMTRKIMEAEEDYNPSLTHGFEFYSEEDRVKMWQAGEKLTKTGESFDLEILMTSPKGNQKWIRIIGQCDFVNEVPSKIYGSFQDINKIKNIELELQNTLEERNTILESIGDAFFTVDQNWVVRYWNKQAENITGRKRAEMVGKILWSVFDKETNSNLYFHYMKAMDNLQIIEVEEFNTDLNLWIEVTIYPSSKGLSIYFKDISVRKIAEEELYLSNERFEMVSEATNEAIWDWDIKNQTHYVGKGFQKLFGHDLVKLTSSYDNWSKYIHPEDKTKVLNSLDNATLDKSAQSWKEEYRYLKSDGTYATVVDRGIFVRDNEGNAIRIIGSVSDITYQIEYQQSLESLNAELEKHTKQLERSNTELERFAFVASHDLQEPLRMVTSFLSQLERKYGHLFDDKAKTYIDFASGGAKRMKQIILDLLEFSRAGKTEDEKEIVDLNEIIKDFIYLRRKIIEEKDVRIIYSDLPQILSFKTPLIQVLHNLMDNAIKYSKDEGACIVELKVAEDENEWIITVSDRGIGIKEEYFEKIFIIFQRLHDRDAYSGTGIGLSIVKKNIEGWGGRVWVESQLDHGSAFSFTIPK